MKAARVLAAKRELVAECKRLGVPLQRPVWKRTIDLAIPRWGVYAKALWNDYVVALQRAAGAVLIPGVKRDNDASGVEWLTRPKGERAALVMVAWAKAGWSESPAGSNRVPQLAAVAKGLGLSSWYQAMGLAWCDFVAHLAGLVVGSTACAEGVGPAHRYNGLYTVESLSVADASRYGWAPVPKAKLRLGVKVWFDFQEVSKGGVDHTGWAVAAPGVAAWGLQPGADEVVCAEGNTSGEGESGSQSNGGKMALRVRPLSIIMGAGAPTR